MAIVKGMLVGMILIIISMTLFIGCTTANQEEMSTNSPPQKLSEESINISLTKPRETVVGTLNPATSPEPVNSSETAASEAPSVANITLEPTSTPNLNSTADLGSRLFMFLSTTGFNYSWLNLSTNHRVEADLANSEISPDSVGSSANLAFSHNSNQVAFWFREPGNPGALWLSDIELRDPQPVYIDNDEFFSSDESFPPRDVTIDWFPNDRYILVSSVTSNIPSIYIDVANNSFEEYELGNCNSIISSPKTSQLAIFCTNDIEQSIVEWNGEIWANPELTSDDIIWGWDENYMLPLTPFGSIPPWSPDGAKIGFVLAEEPNVLQVITDSGEGQLIKFDVDTLYPHTIRWIDNEKLLIGGYQQDWPASWFVVDSNSGQILWSLEETSGFDFTPQQQSELRFLGGEISNYGEYLILSTNRTDIPSGNQLHHVDITNNQYLGVITDIGHGLDAFSWGR